MTKLIVNYSNNTYDDTLKLGDYEIKDNVYSIVQLFKNGSKLPIIQVNQEIIVHWFRVILKTGRLNVEDFEFRIDNEPLPIYQNGRFPEYPKVFTIWEEYLDNMVG